MNTGELWLRKNAKFMVWKEFLVGKLTKDVVIQMNGQLSETVALKKGIISWGIKGVLYKAYVGVVLMLSAGRWNWTSGWLYVVIFLLFDLATAIVVIPRYPDLLIERTQSNPGIKSWDKKIMPLAAGIFPLISWILAGLNQRLGWTPVVGVQAQLIGLILTIMGHALIVWAMGANAFFSALVRIQKERGHTVATGGPYRIIRHPGYLGAMVFSISVPILLGSWWGVIPGVAAAVLYVVRTSMEDKTLKEELPGYDEYTNDVKFRLIPGLW